MPSILQWWALRPTLPEMNHSGSGIELFVQTGFATAVLDGARRFETCIEPMSAKTDQKFRGDRLFGLASRGNKQ